MFWIEGHRKSKINLPKLIFGSFLIVLAVSVKKVRADDSFNYGNPGALASSCELDNVLQSLLTSEELKSMQVRALRNELLHILQKLEDNEPTPDYESLSDGRLLFDLPASEEKRSVASLARAGQLPSDLKRNIGALAKSGYLRNAYAFDGKRSIANLAKNGQLPTLSSPEADGEIQVDEDKRSISSLARSGMMNRFYKRGLESLARGGYFTGSRFGGLYDSKRSIGSLARNGYMKREIDNFLDDLYEKRYIGSLARQFNLPSGKRNLGSLAKNGELYNHKTANNNVLEYGKRNFQALMRGGGFEAGKRNIASFFRSQNSPRLSQYEEYKRNIGTIARDWSLPNHSNSWEREDKRNVAALLRQDSFLHSVDRNANGEANPTPDDGSDKLYDSKRNLAALKAQATSNYVNYGNKNSKRSVTTQEAHNKASGKQGEHARSKREADNYMDGSEEYSVPVMQNTNNFDYEELVDALYGDKMANEKRFLGNIPLSRMADLGKISLMGQPASSNTTPTNPTYRRRQYLLSRTRTDENANE